MIWCDGVQDAQRTPQPLGETRPTARRRRGLSTATSCGKFEAVHATILRDPVAPVMYLTRRLRLLELLKAHNLALVRWGEAIETDVRRVALDGDVWEAPVHIRISMMGPRATVLDPRVDVTTMRPFLGRALPQLKAPPPILGLY
jgi:hypothetical protein